MSAVTPLATLFAGRQHSPCRTSSRLQTCTWQYGLPTFTPSLLPYATVPSQGRAGLGPRVCFVDGHPRRLCNCFPPSMGPSRCITAEARFLHVANPHSLCRETFGHEPLRYFRPLHTTCPLYCSVELPDGILSLFQIINGVPDALRVNITG